MKHTFNPDKHDADNPDSLTNGRRARIAAYAVASACKARLEPITLDVDGIRDLLADLGHLCDRESLNFHALIRTAKADWRAER